MSKSAKRSEQRTVTLSGGEQITVYWASNIGRWVTIPGRDDD